MKLIHVYCSNISAHLGVMGVMQNAIADTLRFGSQNIEIIGSDYEFFYRFEWDRDIKQIITTKVEDSRNPDMVIFNPWGKYHRILSIILRSKLKGAEIGIWTFGFFTWQQNLCNWEGGKKPLILKKILTKGIKFIFKPLVNHYLVSGSEEIKFSRLDPLKCVKITFGAPQSDLLDVAREDDKPFQIREKKNIVYIGRGQWIEKGVNNIIKYSQSDHGREWNYQFFFSKKDENCARLSNDKSSNNIEIIEDVYGADLYSYVKDSVALFTLNQNPTQLRSLYEALSVGTMVVVMREALIDEIKVLLEKHGAGESVMIVKREEVESLSYKVEVTSNRCRKITSEVIQELLDRKHFGTWFASWLNKPSENKNYYDYIHHKIERKKDIKNKREINIPNKVLCSSLL